MGARSIAELLPRPFDQLTSENVVTIAAGGGEERESIVLELKAELRGDLRKELRGVEWAARDACRQPQAPHSVGEAAMRSAFAVAPEPPSEASRRWCASNAFRAP